MKITVYLGDLNCIAGGTAKNGVFIWDIGAKKIIKKFTEVNLTDTTDSWLHCHVIQTTLDYYDFELLHRKDHLNIISKDAKFYKKWLKLKSNFF